MPPGTCILAFSASCGECVFLATKSVRNGFAKKNAAWFDRLGDYSTALEYEPSHVLRRIRYGEEKPIFLRTPVYEEISPYHKSPITESPADERR